MGTWPWVFRPGPHHQKSTLHQKYVVNCVCGFESHKCMNKRTFCAGHSGAVTPKSFLCTPNSVVLRKICFKRMIEILPPQTLKPGYGPGFAKLYLQLEYLFWSPFGLEMWHSKTFFYKSPLGGSWKHFGGRSWADTALPVMTILLFIGVLQCLAVLRAFCQWKVEHQVGYRFFLCHSFFVTAFIQTTCIHLTPRCTILSCSYCTDKSLE